MFPKSRIFEIEIKVAAELNGGDRAGKAALLDKGFWDDNDIMDPKTCGTGSIYIPSGPWATCEYILNVSMPMFISGFILPPPTSRNTPHEISVKRDQLMLTFLTHDAALNEDRNNRLQFSGTLMRQSLIVGPELSKTSFFSLFVCLHPSLEIYQSVNHSCRSVLRKCGLREDVLDEWIERAVEGK